MIHFFKSKTKIKNEYFQKGRRKQKVRSDKEWQAKYDLLKSEANKIIAKKDKENKKNNARVKDIEAKLEAFMTTLAESRVYAIGIEAMERAEHNRITDHYKEIYDKTNSIVSLFRVADKKSEKLMKAIEQYHIDTIQ